MKLTNSEIRELYEEARRQIPYLKDGESLSMYVSDYDRWINAHDYWSALEKNDDDSDWGWSKYDYPPNLEKDFIE